VINVDDPHGETLARTLDRANLDLWTVSQRAGSQARLVAKDIVMNDRGTQLTVCAQGRQVSMQAPVLGAYNVSNLLGVIASLGALGYGLEEAVSACEHLQAVPGRLEFESRAGAPLAVVDYAHTPDALQQVLGTLQPLAQMRGGKLWCVFGCGGDRDPSKRELMGKVAAAHAHHIVVTNDNPRSETPEAIAQAVLAGCAGHAQAQIVLDRARAIAQAVLHADARDVILVAGKGHETYQEQGGVRQPFSDRHQVQMALDERQSKELA
jgi:UDP-N-acetylmuramoyl-L-alanyl-D-glutamate--2,6-diaminopimelate ligase